MAAFVFDTFTGTTGTLWSAHTGETGATWTIIRGTDVGPTAALDTGFLKFFTTSTTAVGAKASGTPPSADYEVFVTISVSGSSTSACSLRLQLRLVDDSNFYCLYWDSAGNNEIEKVVSGSTTTLLAGSTTALADGDVIKLSVSGNTLTAYQNGSLILTTTDSTFSAAGNAGIRHTCTATGNSVALYYLDDFTAQGSAQSVSPNSATLDIGATTTLTASGFTGGSVTWASNHTNIATVDSSGVVTGIAHHQGTQQTATITATGVSNPSETAVATILVNPAIVTVLPATANIPLSGTRQFFATVTGATDTSVTWTAASGSINASTGLYTAPSGTASGITITATSVADTSRTGTATVAAVAGTDAVLPVAAFGPVYAGLTTVEYKRFDTAHAQVQDWSADNLVEIPTNSGYYEVTEPLSTTYNGWIYFRSASSGGVYAVATFESPAAGTLTRPLPAATFGPGYTGLSTVGYQLLNSDYTINTAWTTTGVTEDVSGTGIYTVSKSLASTFKGYVEWRTDSGMTVTQASEIFPLAPLGGGGGSRIFTGM